MLPVSVTEMDVNSFRLRHPPNILMQQICIVSPLLKLLCDVFYFLSFIPSSFQDIILKHTAACEDLNGSIVIKNYCTYHLPNINI